MMQHKFPFLSCIFSCGRRLWTSTSIQPRWNFAFRNNRQCMMPCLRTIHRRLLDQELIPQVTLPEPKQPEKARENRVQVRFYSNRKSGSGQAQRLFPDQFPSRIRTAPLRKIRLIQGIHSSGQSPVKSTAKAEPETKR